MSVICSTAEQAARIHSHACPECGKEILCDRSGEACERYVAKILHDFPCEGQRRKKYEVAEGICIHCGEEKTTEEMEPLSNGDASNCCRDCWKEFKEAEQAELPARHLAWLASVAREEAEALRRSRTKAQKKHDDLESQGQMVIEGTKGNLRLVK